MERKTIDQLIKEIEENKEEYGNVNCYNVKFYIEKGTKTYFVTI